MLLSLLRCSGWLQGQCYVIVRVFWVVIGNCYAAGVPHLQGVFKHAAMFFSKGKTLVTVQQHAKKHWVVANAMLWVCLSS